MNFLDAYANYLFRREVAILMTFRRRGRTRRLFIPAYWRATSLPLVMVIGIFFALLLGAGQTFAAICGFLTLAGALVGEYMLFAQNKAAWPVFERVLNWDSIAKYHQQAIGPLPSMASAEDRQNAPASPSVPIPMRRMILKGYASARRNPPTFQAWVSRAPELRVIGFVVLLSLVFAFGPFDMAGTGYWQVVPSFFIGLQLRRVKMALDFILTWPMIERFIDWQAVYRDGGTAEEVEF